MESNKIIQTYKEEIKKRPTSFGLNFCLCVEFYDPLRTFQS